LKGTYCWLDERQSALSSRNQDSANRREARSERTGDRYDCSCRLSGARAAVTVHVVARSCTRRFAESWFLELSADWRSSSQQYVPFNATQGAKVNVVENRFDFAGWAGYDFGELLDAGGRLELVPLAGAAVVTARNDGFGFDIVGPAGGCAPRGHSRRSPSASWRLTRTT